MNEAKMKAHNEKYCSECGSIINVKAEICPKCGVRQIAPKMSTSSIRKGSLWPPSISMVLGVLTLLACFDESPWDSDTITGFVFFILVSFILGVVSLSTQEKGKGMATTGIIFSILSLIALGVVTS